jgi:hypothetical protein
LKGVVFYSPTFRFFNDTRQRIHYYIEVGRKMQSMKLYVVARVDHDDNILCWNDIYESLQKLGRSNAASKANKPISPHNWSPKMAIP